MDTFITTDDYRVVIGEQSLKIITQAELHIRQTAEAVALEEVAGYLRPTYDIQVIYALQGPARPAHLVMVVTDVALYHLSASLPQRLGADIRKERYDRAIKWLEQVQRGHIVPHLPRAGENNNTNSSSGSLRWGSNKKNINIW